MKQTTASKRTAILIIHSALATILVGASYARPQMPASGGPTPPPAVTPKPVVQDGGFDATSSINSITGLSDSQAGKADPKAVLDVATKAITAALAAGDVNAAQAIATAAIKATASVAAAATQVAQSLTSTGLAAGKGQVIASALATAAVSSGNSTTVAAVSTGAVQAAIAAGKGVGAISQALADAALKSGQPAMVQATVQAAASVAISSGNTTFMTEVTHGAGLAAASVTDGALIGAVNSAVDAAVAAKGGNAAFSAAFVAGTEKATLGEAVQTAAGGDAPSAQQQQSTATAAPPAPTAPPAPPINFTQEPAKQTTASNNS